jgi:hypothetical protein
MAPLVGELPCVYFVASTIEIDNENQSEAHLHGRRRENIGDG